MDYGNTRITQHAPKASESSEYWSWTLYGWRTSCQGIAKSVTFWELIHVHLVPELSWRLEQVLQASMSLLLQSFFNLFIQIFLSSCFFQSLFYLKWDSNSNQRSTTGPFDPNGIKTTLTAVILGLLNINVWNLSNHASECCHFVLGSMRLWCQEQGWYVW